MRQLIILLSAASSGCVTIPYEKTYTPDGRLAARVTCSGIRATHHDCRQKLRELCEPNGYEIFDTARERSGMARAYGDAAFVSNSEKRRLVGRCKGNNNKRINKLMVQQARAANTRARTINAISLAVIPIAVLVLPDLTDLARLMIAALTGFR